MMWPLQLSLLWALLFVSRGAALNVGEISAQPGSEVLLPVTRRLTLSSPDGQSCDHVIWRRGESDRGPPIAEIRRCRPPVYNTTLFPNVKISENGSLIISPVTAEHAGRYNVTIYDSKGTHTPTEIYTLHVEAPVSDPLLNISCLQDGRAQISCRVVNGTHYTIYLNVTGPSEGRSSSNSSNITITVPASDPWSVSCTAENRVSRREIIQTREACPVSLSSIAVNSSCLRDGSAEAFCWVVNGSDPQFSWSLDGKSREGISSSSYSRVTLLPPVSGILRCDVTNKISMLNESKNVSCPVPVSLPDISVSCLSNGSAEISCVVTNGTDPSFNLTVNGTTKVYNEISHNRRISVIVPDASHYNVSCSVRNGISNSSAMKMSDACPVPRSAPNVTVSCQKNGSAIISCVVEKQQDVTYNWTVNRRHQREYHTDTITFSDHNFTSGALNVTCSVNSSLGVKESNITQVFCPAPVSVPLVNVSCLPNGIANISCWVRRGTDPRFSLTLNGKSVLANSGSSWMEVNYTVHTAGPWNVSCSVTNSLNVTETHRANLTCSESCYTCLQKSIIGGSGFLLLMSPFYIFAYWYTLRDVKKES